MSFIYCFLAWFMLLDLHDGVCATPVTSYHPSPEPYPSSFSENATSEFIQNGVFILSTSGSLGGNRFTCADAYGSFPCTCLRYFSSMHTSTLTDPASTYTITELDLPQPCTGTCIENEAKFSVKDITVWTESSDVYPMPYYSGVIPPTECGDVCDIKAPSVRIMFWPVHDDNTTVQNVTKAAGTLQSITVSDGFTFTSPSVYVAYDNIRAVTYFRRYDTEKTGQFYNTTVAYRPEELSTSVCWAVNAVFEAINYTQLQYPPPNSFYTNCVMPRHESSWKPESETEIIGASPMFSYPPDVTLLVPSWKSCGLSVTGAFDPPRTLGRASAMGPVSSSSPPAAPAAHVTPTHAPATPTPSPKGPPGSTSFSAASPMDPGDPGSISDPKARSKAGHQPDPPQPTPQNANNPQTNDPPGKYDPPNDRPSNNAPASNGPPGSDSPKTHISPSNYNDNSSNDPPTNNPPSNNNPSINDPPSNKDPASNDSPSKNDPHANYPPKNDPASIDLTPVPASPPANMQPQGVQNQSPSSAATNRAAHDQAQDIRTLIANVFGYVPVSTVLPVNNPFVANSGPESIETVVNGSPSPVMVGGATVRKISNGAMPVAGQTVPQGSQATVSGVVVSVGNNGVAIDGTNHAFSPLASETPIPLVVGGNTAHEAPNGGLVVASHTLAPGAQATVAGVVVSVDSSNAILDGTTHIVAPIAPTPVSIIVTGVATALQPAEAGASQAPVINVGGQDITSSPISPSVGVADLRSTPGIPDQGSPYIDAGQRLTPGGAAINVSGTPISLPAAQTPAGNLPAIATEAPAAQAGEQTPVTRGNQVFTPNPSAFAIAGSTLSAGAPGVTLAGTLISLQPLGGGLVIGSSTLALAAPTASPESPTPVTLGGQVFTPNPTAFAIAGTTLTAGAPGVTLAGTLVSLQPLGGGLVIGSSTLALVPSAVSPESLTPVTIGNQIFSPNPSAFAIAGTTISAGGPGVIVAGTVVSLQPSGAGLIVGSSTFTLATASHTFATSAATIGNHIFTPKPTGFSIDGTSISAGGPGIAVDGTVVSLRPLSGGGGLVVGSSTLALASPPPTPGPITIGSELFTPDPTGFSIAGTTISAGGPGVKVNGTAVSLQRLSDGAELVVGSSTIELVRTTVGTSVPSVSPSPATGDTNTTSTAGITNPTSPSSSGATTGSSLRPPPASSSSQKLSLRGQGGLWFFISIALLAFSSLLVT